MGGQKKPGDYVAMASMFFAGLILLIPHRIGMSRVNYVIKRYNLPISRAGLLLYKYHNNIELSLLHGTLAGNIIVWTAPALSLGGNSANEKKAEFIRIFMIVFLFFMLLSSIIMYIIYISGGDFGHLNAFYFSLIFLTLFDGFTNAFAFALNAKYSSLLSAGIPLSGFLVTLLHWWNTLEDDDQYNLDDFDYHVLQLQLIWNIIQIIFALGLWALDAGLSWNSGHPPSFDLAPLIQASGDKAHTNDWSPILLLAISLGTVYAFYPSIAPYSIIDHQYASVIELWILIISAILPLLFAILDLVTSIVTTLPTALGPSGKIEFAYISTFDITATSSSCNWASGTKTGGVTKNWKSAGYYWNLIWICAIFYILCIQIFMSLLHYPDCLLSCFFNNNPYTIVFISIFFNTLRELMQACGFAGAGKQINITATHSPHAITCMTGSMTASDPHQTGCPNKGKTTAQSVDRWSTANNDSEEKMVNGSIAATNKLITLFVMMFCVFTGDGYLQHYRRCCRDCWPTTGYTKYQSFFYWLHYGFKGGIKSITSSFTTTV